MASSLSIHTIRVAMVLYRDSLDVGGSLRVVEALADAFNPQEVEVHLVFAYGEPGPVAHRVKAPCHFLRSKGPQDFIGWMRARKIIARIAPDILHFHNPVYWLHAALAGAGYCKLIHLHGPFFVEDMRWPDRVLSRIMPKLVHGQVCITDELRDLVLLRRWGDAERTWTVYNGIDCGLFSQLPSRSEARASLQLPPDALILAMVCRLAWYKGCQDAVRILSRLSPQWHVVFCGDGPIRSELLALAAELGVAERIHFTGMLTDVRPVYAAANVFLFLSRLEPFGLVLAESMAARLPVFGLGGAGGYRDSRYPLVTVDNAVMGERSNVDDFEAIENSTVLDQLAGRIAEFEQNPDLFLPMVDRAEAWVRDRFDGPIQARSLLTIYRRVCES